MFPVIAKSTVEPVSVVAGNVVADGVIVGVVVGNGVGVDVGVTPIVICVDVVCIP
jgi:hypothetical protein